MRLLHRGPGRRQRRDPRSLKRVDLGNIEWCFGRVRASEQVTGYVTKHTSTQKVLSEHDLDMPLHSYETRASWWVPALRLAP